MISRFAVLITLLATNFAAAAADDWPQWGGPKRDLVWREAGIVDTLPTDGLLPRVWSTPIAEGYSGPAVADGKVYVTDRVQREELERVHCLDAATGEILWTHEYPCRYSIGYPFGPRATPVVDGDRVYTIGAQGNMFCLNVANGKPVWSKDFVTDFDTFLPKWGMVAAPLVDGDQLITLVGGKNNALIVSFNKHTGAEIWRSLEDRVVGYGTPLFMEFGGRRQLIVWHAKALSALDPVDGKVIWEYPFNVNYGLTVPLPRKSGNRLFLTAFYEGPQMLEVADDGRSAKLLWQGHATSETEPDGIHSIMSTPVFTGSHVYGVSSYGQMMCQDAVTGKVLWSTYDATGRARWWNVFFIPHEDRYFLHNQQGDLIIAELSPEGYKEISRARLVEPTRKVSREMTIWSHPAFAMKSVFARNDKEIVRVNLAR